MVINKNNRIIKGLQEKVSELEQRVSVLEKD